MNDAIRGWDGPFLRFRKQDIGPLVAVLRARFGPVGEGQSRAWRESIPLLQEEVAELSAEYGSADDYTAILEYQLPLEFRRVDAVFLLHDAVVVIELKGKLHPTEADLDQAQAYARDLRAYHAECADRPVHAVLVPTRAKGDAARLQGNVHVCPPAALDGLLLDIDRGQSSIKLDAFRFLSEQAYRPLPTLVKAARELFSTGSLRRVRRASAATEPATECVLGLTRDAAAQKRRKLILLSGVPGAGKTLVGLRLVHSHELDELAVDRGNGKPTAPAVFLSGNGPLVEVLSYELRDAGGNGRTFVRGVKQYVERYLTRPELIPPEHVLVYDEAQRAYDAAMVAEKHDHPIADAKSEPELFIEFAERVPDWCVVVALIGTGQEIHKGEEGGVEQWAAAISKSPVKDQWDVHGASWAAEPFRAHRFATDARLTLDKTLRSHLAFEVHRFVGELLKHGSQPEGAQAPVRIVSDVRGSYGEQESPNVQVMLQALSAQIAAQGHQLKITRDLDAAKRYLKERYSKDSLARYGLLASSRDRDLERFQIPNDFQSTKRTKFGPWYGDDEDAPGGYSCRHLRECVTEFGAQGLELDGALLAWGTDFVRKGGRWSNERARRYVGRGAPVRDAAQLRANAYRVLLTRARDGTVVFVPLLPELNETFEFLRDCGFSQLSMSAAD